MILEFEDPSNDPVLFLENALGDIVVRDQPDEISECVEKFQQLEDIAGSPEEFIVVVDDALSSFGA